MGSELAHINQQDGREHSLTDHLRDVGALAGSFARAWGSAPVAELLGKWHDLGKYRQAFQNMIRAANGENAHLEGTPKTKVDHSSPGAIHARDELQRSGISNTISIPIQLAIAGHHCGLQNRIYWEEDRLPRTNNLLSELPLDHIPEDILRAKEFSPPEFLKKVPDNVPRKEAAEILARRIEFWTRMIFSALVDADFLDTEAFFNKERSKLRGDFPEIADLADRLKGYLDDLSESAPNTEVNAVRADVLRRCQKAAAEKPGVFSLTVPTGGGKTYTSLSFALEHARRHRLDRVVVVAPFLTIIDQTITAYRKALSETEDQAVLIEQHSGIDPDKESARNRLAVENWDASLIVTTAVQFFESLFANRTSKCRKLHNLAHAVIVIDEAQTLPGKFLIPIIDVLQELVDHYGASVVLSTATQPVLVERKASDGRRVPGFREIREIAGDQETIRKTFQVLRRVRAERVETKDWDEVAVLIAAEPRALAIVHLRNDARKLAEKVRALRPNESLYHLSALMCAAHRRERLDEIRRALKDGDPIRVVSTQLVEAGVDLDFPVVFRATAGFDALIQSAGRCNREGTLGPDGGRLVIFDAPTEPPVGVLKTAAGFAKAQLNGDPTLLERLFEPETFSKFYAALENVHDGGIQEKRAKLAFEDVAATFQLIEDGWRAPIVVPHGEEPKEFLDAAERTDNPSYLRKLARKLQPFTVEIPRRQVEAWLQAGVLRTVQGMFHTLTGQYEHLYDPQYGLIVTKETPAADPEKLIG